MSLTKEDLLAIQAVLTPQFEKIDARFEKIEEELKSVRHSVAKLETLPKQIQIIAEGHLDLDRNVQNLCSDMQEVKEKISNAVIVRAAQ